ncbi:hypothetical protein Tco_0234958, partial [Tanacetum coccineum]
NFVPKAVLMKTGMKPVNAAKPKAAYNAVKRNMFNVVKASAFKHAQPEEVQELLGKLVQDVKIISDELSEYINTPAWNRPLVYCDDDDVDNYAIYF